MGNDTFRQQFFGKSGIGKEQVWNRFVERPKYETKNIRFSPRAFPASNPSIIVSHITSNPPLPTPSPDKSAMIAAAPIPKNPEKNLSIPIYIPFCVNFKYNRMPKTLFRNESCLSDFLRFTRTSHLSEQHPSPGPNYQNRKNGFNPFPLYTGEYQASQNPSERRRYGKQ